MKKIYFILLIIPFLGFSQEKLLWSKSNAKRVNNSQLVARNSTPSKSDIYSLDFQGLKTVLNSAASRNTRSTSDVYLKFPNESGEMERYQIYNASIMEPDFAAKHPEIQSYVGINMDDPGTTMRFSTTVLGFHAAIYTIGKTYYIDPYTSDLNTYTYYAKENLYSDIERLGCQMTEELQQSLQSNREENLSTQRNSNDGLLRSFRFALASTQEYSNFHINLAGQQAASDAIKKATVLAAMNVTMNRVNGLLERDLSVTLNLVDNTSIIFLEEDDGYTNDNGATMLNENQIIIDNNIETANYDIGHVFSTGGGGVASLGGICISNRKSRAVTGLPNPVGDPFDVNFVAHEIGHHFGANHTFNGGEGFCGSQNQRSPGTTIEPGSGTTIMGYAGICDTDDIQQNSDDHFHAISIDQIYDRLTASGSYTGFPICSVNTTNGNQAPTANAGQDYTIPFGTAFTLTGNGNDLDGGILSFNWEQTDSGITTDQPTTISTTDPQFRSYPSTSNPERTFPQLSDVLNDNLTPQWEVIPNVARTMGFALTVRDNQSPNGGQTNRDDMLVTVANTGPFVITSQTTNEVFTENSSTLVTWDVAGTNANDINTSQVNILLSTDGGLNFDNILASNTSNDGNEIITFPSGVTSGDCRIKIEPIGNIYFAINTAFFAIGNYTIGTGDICEDYTFNLNRNIPTNSSSLVGVSLNIPDSFTLTDVNVNVNITHPNNRELVYGLRSPQTSNGFQTLFNQSCNGTSDTNLIFDDNASIINCATINTGGNASPVDPLSVINNQNSFGDWVFFFTDVISNNNNGTLNTITLNLCRQGAVATLNDNDFELNDFSLFPNPNNGDFNLQFNSNSGKDINVNVYDISGKLVFDKAYDSTARFNEQIQLNNVSSGIYIMKVSDSDKTITRKLIIE